MSEEQPTATEVPPVNVTRLIHEAASKSGLLWVRLPDGSTHPAWHVWHDDGDDRGTGPAAYVVSGPGEQPLPWLPDEVELVLRSKDTGGRLVTVHATAREVTPEDAGWDDAVEVLRPARLNAVGDIAAALAAVVHHPPAHPARPARRGPGPLRRRLRGRRGAPGGPRDERLAPLALARPRRRPPQHPGLTSPRGARAATCSPR